MHYPGRDAETKRQGSSSGAVTQNCCFDDLDSVSERIARAECIVDGTFGAVHRLTDCGRTRMRGVVALWFGNRVCAAGAAILRRALDQQSNRGSARAIVADADGNHETSVLLSLFHADLPVSSGIVAWRERRSGRR